MGRFFCAIMDPSQLVETWGECLRMSKRPHDDTNYGLQEVITKLTTFQEDFMKTYGGGGY